MFRYIRAALLPAVAGLALYVSFRFNWWVLAIAAVAIFYSSLLDKDVRNRLLVTFAFASAFFVPLLWWISTLGFDALLLLSGLCASGFLLIAINPIRSGNFWHKVEFATGWAVIELIRCQVPWGGFSWGLLGYSQNSGPLVNFARVGSATLVAFVTVLLATIIAEMHTTRSKPQTFLALALIALSYLFPNSKPTGDLRVGVVQGGVVSSLIPDYAKPSQVFLNHLQQTQDHARLLRSADLVVWPENSVNLQNDSDSARFQIQKVVDEIGKPFLIGEVRHTIEGHPQNIVSLWLPKAGESTSYIKNHLVPFGEYIPMRNLLAPHITRLNQIPADFERGNGGGLIDVAGSKVGVAICFEVADQGHLTQLVNTGAQILIAASNNATYLGTNQPAQQFEISRFSAMAHQRSMVVATTSGVSGVISPSGQISQRIEDSGGHTFVARVGLYDNKVRADRWPLAQCLIIGLLSVLLALRKLAVWRREGRINSSINLVNQ